MLYLKARLVGAKKSGAFYHLLVTHKRYGEVIFIQISCRDYIWENFCNEHHPAPHDTIGMDMYAKSREMKPDKWMTFLMADTVELKRRDKRNQSALFLAESTYEIEKKLLEFRPRVKKPRAIK